MIWSQVAWAEPPKKSKWIQCCDPYLAPSMFAVSRALFCRLFPTLGVFLLVLEVLGLWLLIMLRLMVLVLL